MSVSVPFITVQCGNCAKYQEEISELKEELKITTKEHSKRIKALEEAHNSDVKKYEENIKNLDKRMRKFETSELNKHNRLLMGSVIFNFIECAAIQVLGKVPYPSPVLVSDIGTLATTTGKEEQWNNFCQEYLNGIDLDFLDSWVKTVKDERKLLAHPTEDFAGEDVSPNSLGEIVNDLYKQKSRKKERELMLNLIKQLDLLALVLDRPILRTVVTD